MAINVSMNTFDLGGVNFCASHQTHNCLLWVIENREPIRCRQFSKFQRWSSTCSCLKNAIVEELNMSTEIIIANEFGRVECSELSTDISYLEITHQLCQAKISLYGGQVLHWQPKDQQPIFWLSRDAIFKQGQAIRGGVPICWPWFGGEIKLPNGELSTTSNHGFSRVSQWQLSDVKVMDQSVVVELALNGQALSPFWPSAFSLKQVLIFSSSFEQSLIITNHSASSVEYTGALHSYFAVSDPAKTTIDGLNSSPYDDKLSGESDQKSDLSNCVGPIDRVYHNGHTQYICDSAWQRKLKITSTNCHQWVLWNPGIAADNMTDVHEGAEHEFVCLEAANTQWQRIAPHSSCHIGQSITVINT